MLGGVNGPGRVNPERCVLVSDPVELPTLAVDL